ncbi:nuclear transport factor 2 family protein [Aquimarina sp. M1]
MKRLVISSLLLLFISCSETKNMSPSETVKTVVESFYAKDNNTLKKHTTSDGYDSLMMIQGLVPDADNDAKVTISDEVIETDTAWVKYSSNYDNKPGIFKLVKDDGQWKVTSKGPREKGPF